MKIVVIGGSGLVGSKLVTTLRHRGHEVLSASRRSGVNTLTGQGLQHAVNGAAVVIDVINSPTFEGTDVLEFFRTSTRNVVAAAEAARVKHHVVLSIVGTDRMLASMYFQAKMMQERWVGVSPIPHTILRSTQFFDFLPRIAAAEGDPRIVRVPPVSVQPIAADEVAAALADLAMATPRNGMIEHGGPELLRLDDIVRRAMRAVRDPRLVIADPTARYFGAELKEDTLTPDEGAIVGVTSFDEWLKGLIASKSQRDMISARDSYVRDLTLT